MLYELWVRECKDQNLINGTRPWRKAGGQIMTVLWVWSFWGQCQAPLVPSHVSYVDVFTVFEPVYFESNHKAKERGMRVIKIL